MKAGKLLFLVALFLVISCGKDIQGPTTTWPDPQFKGSLIIYTTWPELNTYCSAVPVYVDGFLVDSLRDHSAWPLNCGDQAGININLDTGLHEISTGSCGLWFVSGQVVKVFRDSCISVKLQ